MKSYIEFCNDVSIERGYSSFNEVIDDHLFEAALDIKDEAAILYGEQMEKLAWDKCYERTKDATFSIGLKGIAPKQLFESSYSD